MLRTIRIIGIIVFALLVGYSAQALTKLYHSGDFFDQYNSQRKADLTLLSVSVLAVASLGFVEVMGLRKSSQFQGYGKRHYREEDEDRIDGKDAASIYATRKVVDPWHGRKVRSSKVRAKPVRESGEVWFRVARFYCAMLPLVYMGTCAFICTSDRNFAFEFWMLPTLFTSLMIIALITAAGIFRKKGWGLSMGYALAMLNLLIFPYGTVVGLLLLICLVGSVPVFTASGSRRQGKRARARSLSI